jgi:RNA polymerase sigma-70 factor (ECF subfamily)
MATDRETFLALVDRHGAGALGMLRRLCGNGHDAEDVFQDVAIRVWKHLGERPRLRDDRAWLLTIAYRAYLDHQARRPPAPMPLFDDDDDDSLGRTGVDRDPDALAERAERARLVNEAVAGLSPLLREIVVLHYTGGLSLRQVAAATGASIGTVKSRLNAGLEQLRRRLS